jgi:hypothetical protein
MDRQCIHESINGEKKKNMGKIAKAPRDFKVSLKYQFCPFPLSCSSTKGLQIRRSGIDRSHGLCPELARVGVARISTVVMPWCSSLGLLVCWFIGLLSCLGLLGLFVFWSVWFIWFV